jgi:2-dehydro-3-deoxy-D-arabinonate dehydratase
VEIVSDGKTVFNGETSINNIKRTFDELVDYLCRSQTFSKGAMLLTGTGVVPDDDFTLAVDDVIRIKISGIGTLENAAATV